MLSDPVRRKRIATSALRSRSAHTRALHQGDTPQENARTAFSCHKQYCFYAIIIIIGISIIIIVLFFSSGQIRILTAIDLPVNVFISYFSFVRPTQHSRCNKELSPPPPKKTIALNFRHVVRTRTERDRSRVRFPDVDCFRLCYSLKIQISYLHQNSFRVKKSTCV